MDNKKEIVVITGGSGCLAQHLIRELQTGNWAEKTKEIRVVDKKIFKKYLGSIFLIVFLVSLLVSCFVLRLRRTYSCS